MQDIKGDLIFAVREGRLERVRDLISSFYGLSYSPAWSEGSYVLLCEALKNKHTEVSKLLLTCGAEVDNKSKEPSDTPLHFAVMNGDIELVKMILGKGANIESKNKFGRTPLFHAIKNKKIEVTELLLMHRAEVHARDNEGDNEDEDGETELHLADEHGNIEIVKLFLQQGANIDNEDEDGKTILHLAVEHGNIEIVKLLLQQGANIDNEDENSKTTLHLAVENAYLLGFQRISTLLLQHGAKVDNYDGDGNTGLHHAVNKECLMIFGLVLEYFPAINNEEYTKIVEALLKYGFTVNPEDAENCRLLHAAVEKGYLKIIEDLFKFGADVNMLFKNRKGFTHFIVDAKAGFTPLHTAVRNKQEEVAKLLISYEADVNATDEYGKTPIFYAIENFDSKITKLLLTNGANTEDSPELLNTAVRNECIEIVEALLLHGADLNASDAYGETALHYTVCFEYPYTNDNIKGDIAKLLLTKGANADAQSKDGITTLHLAVQSGCKEVVKVLLEGGADVNNNAFEGTFTTPLHIAAKNKQEEVAKLLISYKADVNASDKYGNTPIFYAIRKSDSKITKLLLTNRANIKDSPELLHIAVENECIEIVEALLQHSADVNATVKYGETPIFCAIRNADSKITKLLLTNSAYIQDSPELLHIAVQNECIEMVETLLQHDADVNAQDRTGKTPILYAIEKSNSKITKLLLTNGANINYSPELLNTAVMNKCIEIVEALLLHGADLNASDAYGETALHYTVCFECTNTNDNIKGEIAKLLLSKGANANAQSKDGITTLHFAVWSGCKEVVNVLLEGGADVNNNAFEGTFTTPLHIAAKNKEEEIAKLLVRYKADVNASDKYGKTPIFYAIQNSDSKITSLLLTNGANIKGSPELLNIAVKNKSIEIVEALLQHEADVNAQDRNGKNPIFYAMENSDSKITKLLLTNGTNIKDRPELLNIAVAIGLIEFVEAFLQHGADINATDKYGETPIFYAIRNADSKITKLLLTNRANIKDSPELLNTAVENECIEIIEDLLLHGADVNASDAYGYTALHYTACFKYPYANANIKGEIAKLLLTKGANADAQSKDGIKTLHLAILSGCKEVVKVLLERGADVNNNAFKGTFTLLHIAAKNKQEEVAKLLISYKADVNASDKYGNTPIFYAIRKSDSKITKLLLTNGANIKDNPELLNTAVKNECIEIVEALLLHGADLNASNAYGYTALHYTACFKNPYTNDNIKGEIAKLLLTKGANANAQTIDGITTLHDAVQSGCKEVVKVLLEGGADVNNAFEGTFTTPLHIAAKNKEEEVAKLLMRYKADVNASVKYGKTPIFYAIENADSKITKLLLTNGANIKDSPELLNIAVKNKSIEIVEALLQHNADVNASVKYGKTPIFYAIENADSKITKLLLTNGAYIKDSPELLNIAVKNKSIEIVEALLQHNADVNASDKYGKTPIFYAIENADSKITKLLLTNGANIKDSPELLNIAVKNKSIEIVEALLQHNADVNARVEYGNTPIFYAIENADSKITKLLLTNGAYIKDNPELLNTAVKNGCIEIVKALLLHGADLNASDAYGETALHYTVCFEYTNTNDNIKGEIAKLLLNKGANANAQSKDGITTLHLAVQSGCKEVVKVLLAGGADVNNNAFEGTFTTPLHIAAQNKQEEVAKLLISYKADVNASDKYGNTPIYYAIRKSDSKITNLLLTNGANIKDSPELLNTAVKKSIDIVEALLQHNADVNARVEYGNTPIFYAIENDDSKITKLLLTNGAYIKDSPELLNTAVKNKSIEIVESLLLHGANVKASDEDGRTALHYTALNVGFKCPNTNNIMVEIAKLLLTKGANPDAQTKNGKTTLHLAAEEGLQRVIGTLLKFGADINFRDKYGKTALHIASEKGRSEVVETLLKYGSDINITPKGSSTALGLINNNLYIFSSNFRRTAKALKRHIIKMKAANLYLSKENVLSLRQIYKINIGEFERECEEEIASMKNEKINNTRISFYDILAKDTISLEVYMRNENIVQVLKSVDYKTKFPKYANMMVLHLRKAMERKELLEQSYNIFHFLVNNFPQLPYDCTEKIFNYLSNKDLQIFVDDWKK